MWETAFFVFLIMGAAWTLSGAGNLLLKKKLGDDEKKAALFVLIVFFVNILDNLIRPEFTSKEFSEIIYHISRPSYLLVGPALLFYIRAILREKALAKITGVLHFLPFLFWLFYFLKFPGTLHPDITFAVQASGAGSPPPRGISMVNLYWDLWKNISLFLYTVVVLVLIHRHRKHVPDLFSFIDRYTTLAWLRNLLYFYLAVYFLNMALDPFFSDSSALYQISMASGRVLPPVCFVFFFSLFSADQNVTVPLPEKSTESEEKGELQKEKGEGKYEKSGMGEKESHELFFRLQTFLEKDKPYLDPELTLEELASAMGETRHRLSETINRESGVKFYRFINTYRLREFKLAIEEDRYPDFTILAIALECGFRSQSAFYSLFKAAEGMTPRAFVLRNREESARGA